ncbi:hypothetical protein [Haladaptatus sp. ZSTT2]|uniref:hypothetical protein n=1 Tax=Haladaptatus sp. ZSTT2 TaxID=3120515 RepID=UPI00300F0EB1
MEWQAYLDRIDTGTGGRYHTGNLVTDATVFDAVVADLCVPLMTAEIDAVAGIDALGADDNKVLNGLRARYAFHAIRDT